MLTSHGDGVVDHAITARDGAFAFPVDAGTWSVSAQGDGLCGTFVDALSVNADVGGVELVLGKPSSGVAIALHVEHVEPLPAGAALYVDRLSDAEGDVWYVPVDRNDVARVIVPAAPSYGANTLFGPLDGRVQIDDPASPPALRVSVRHPPAQDVVAAVRARAIPIATADPTAADLADLARLGRRHRRHPRRRDRRGDAQLARELFQLKHRVLEYLVASKGFTAFALEADQAEVRAVDRYVQGGAGSAGALVEQDRAVETWQTDELVAFVQWMRDYNATADGRGHARVHIVGSDMQSYTSARGELQRFLDRVDPQRRARR